MQSQNSQYPQENGSAPRRSRRAEIACDTCRFRKVKCWQSESGKRCDECISRKLECTYNPVGVAPPQRMERLPRRTVARSRSTQPDAGMETFHLTAPVTLQPNNFQPPMLLDHAHTGGNAPAPPSMEPRVDHANLPRSEWGPLLGGHYPHYLVNLTTPEMMQRHVSEGHLRTQFEGGPPIEPCDRFHYRCQQHVGTHEAAQVIHEPVPMRREYETYPPVAGPSNGHFPAVPQLPLGGGQGNVNMDLHQPQYVFDYTGQFSSMDPQANEQEDFTRTDYSESDPR